MLEDVFACFARANEAVRKRAEEHAGGTSDPASLLVQLVTHLKRFPDLGGARALVIKRVKITTNKMFHSICVTIYTHFDMNTLR